MATKTQVLKTLLLLVDANLSFPPRDVESTANVWVRLLDDVPGEILEQAALDHIASNGEFPKLSDLRAAAKQVQIHNNTSAAPSPWRPIPEPVIIWMPAGITDLVKFPPAIEARLVKLATLDRLLTDVEMAGIDALTAPFLETL